MVVVLVRTMVRAVSGVTPLAADQRVEQRHIVAIARIVLGVDDLEIAPELEVQAEALDAALDDRGAADQDRLGDAGPRSAPARRAARARPRHRRRRCACPALAPGR